MLDLNKVFELSFVKKLQCCCASCMPSGQHLGTAPKLVTFVDEGLAPTVCLCAECILPAIVSHEYNASPATCCDYEGYKQYCVGKLLAWSVGGNHTYQRIGSEIGDYVDAMQERGKWPLHKSTFTPTDLITRDLTCWCYDCMLNGLKRYGIKVPKYCADIEYPRQLEYCGYKLSDMADKRPNKSYSKFTTKDGKQLYVPDFGYSAYSLNDKHIVAKFEKNIRDEVTRNYYTINECLDDIDPDAVVFLDNWFTPSGRFWVSYGFHTDEYNPKLAKLIMSGKLLKIIYYSDNGDGYRGYWLRKNECDTFTWRFGRIITDPEMPHYDGDFESYEDVLSTAFIIQQYRDKSAKEIIDKHGEARAKIVFRVLDTYCNVCQRYRGACMGHNNVPEYEIDQIINELDILKQRLELLRLQSKN